MMRNLGFHHNNVRNIPRQDYNQKDLINLEELGYIDLWKCNSNGDSDRYAWYYCTGTEFRIDYVFVSSNLGNRLMDVSSTHNKSIRESKISDHSPLIIFFNIK
jgi:exonuclease III